MSEPSRPDAGDGLDADEGETVIVDRSVGPPDEGETVIVDRSVGPPDEGETVVVDRSAGALDEGETVVVDRSAGAIEEGETVVVDRRPGAADAAAATGDEHTVVVDRPGRTGEDVGAAPVGADDEAFADTILPDFEADTIIGARSGLDGGDGGGAAESTVVVDRPGRPPRDSTAGDAYSDAPDVLDGPGADSGSGPSGSAEASGRLASSGSSGRSTGLSGLADSPATPRRRLGGRRTLQLAPLEPIDLRSSVRAVGAGAVEYYRPRQLPTAAEAPSIETDPTPPREPSRALPSIARRSRRGAVAAILTVIACVVVGVAGAVTVTGLLLAG